ncbi:MAG: DUF2220 family protein [Wenzhouxiangellaceae bacterium]|nr:DUF2220 family protein [Wenzhouxiangellaceae bacterium]
MSTADRQTAWSLPADLADQVRKRWDQGLLLGPPATIAECFPITLRLKRPRPADLNERFNDVRDWVAQLTRGDRAHRGFGYDIEWNTVNHRVHGANRLPAGVSIPTREDALKLIGKTAAAATFDRLYAHIVAEFPQLADWLARRPITALDHADEWPRLLAVLAWFRQHPRPGMYLRELDIEGVDTKFIERRRKRISELLDQVLESRHIEAEAKGARGFDRRYGLRQRPALVRFRTLDPALDIQGINDLSLPADQFATLDLDAATVFITENEINGLAFPPHPSAIVIFGLGYGLDRLAQVDWLAERRIYYWGDIDTHGFAILNRLRHHLPQAESLLMDRATLDAHRPMWTREPKDRRFTGQLDRLTHSERQLFETLRDDVIDERIRLEQERIRFGWLSARLRDL